MSDQVPIVWDRAEGVWVWDIDGNCFLDFSSGVLVVNTGHSNPELVNEMCDQTNRVINCYDFLNLYRPLLAKKLVEITPDNLDKAFILTTGSETTEAAVKMARKFTGRYEIIAFQGAFHGRTFGAMSIGGKRSGAGTKGFGPFLPGVIHAPFANCYRCVFDKTYPDCNHYCIDYLDWLVETETEDNIAAVISEPYQGGAGSIIPPPGWFKKLETWCCEKDILLIIDEVQASFGRTGTLFCFEQHDITPNILCLGKGISSGLPVAAVVGESRIMDILTEGSLSSTHGGNPFCSRIAIKNIEIIIEERLSDNAANVGSYILERFKHLESEYYCIGDVRGQGLVLGIEIVSDHEKKIPDREMAKRIVRAAYESGLLMIAPIGHYGNVLRIAPPLVITMEEAETAMDIIYETFKSLS